MYCKLLTVPNWNKYYEMGVIRSFSPFHKYMRASGNLCMSSILFYFMHITHRGILTAWLKYMYRDACVLEVLYNLTLWLRHLMYRTWENVGVGKNWRIWRIVGSSPIFYPSNIFPRTVYKLRHPIQNKN